jgi:hypothetical protein
MIAISSIPPLLPPLKAERVMGVGRTWLDATGTKKFKMNIVWSRYFLEECNPSTVTVKLDPSGLGFCFFKRNRNLSRES